MPNQTKLECILILFCFFILFLTESTKKKATRLNTEDFVDTNTIRINNWADEMEDEEPLPMNKPVLPSAPKSIRSGQDYDPKLLPQSAPFCASITNIHFEAKEDEIINMLAPIKVMRVDFNSDNGRFSGTAVIEFSTIEDLIQGLGAQKSIRGRPFYIQLPNPNGDFSGKFLKVYYSLFLLPIFLFRPSPRRWLQQSIWWN